MPGAAGTPLLCSLEDGPEAGAAAETGCATVRGEVGGGGQDAMNPGEHGVS